MVFLSIIITSKCPPYPSYLNSKILNRIFLLRLKKSISSRCTLRFPSTDMCITFSSLINNNVTTTNNNNTTTTTSTNSNPIVRSSPDNISRPMSNDPSQQQQQRLSSSALPIETNNPSTTSSLLLQSVPNVSPQQQVILVAVNQHPQRTVNQATNNHESNGNLPTLNLHVSNSLPTVNRINGQLKTQYETCTTVNSLIG